MTGRIHRDEYGIPQLWAPTVDELAYQQGCNAATDRAWQIEVERWRSEGILAARLGPDSLAWDRFARRVRLDDTARGCFERLDPATRSWITAYVDGVNAALPAGATGASEFAVTGTTPGRWSPHTPLGVFLVQHILFGTFPQKLWRAHLDATLAPVAVDLFGGPAETGGSGSNAWALTGDRTPGGAPIIAGDPHRVLELPGIYQQVRLACPEFDVIGLAFPGVPGLPHFGHAGGVAWAVTNAMSDYQDLYREQFRRDGDRLLVREATGWEPIPSHLETIEVRGAATESVEVIETARGPVIDVDRDTGEAISLRTPSRVSGGLGFDALLPLLRARSVDDVVAGLRDWVEPVNSVLVADRTGAVKRLVAGQVPVRDDACRRVPVPGWEPRYRWRPGYAPTPTAAVDGLVVNANDRRPGDVAELGVDFAPPHRAHRITELLTAGAEPAAIHSDTRLASTILRDLLAGLAPGGLDEPARLLRDRLVAWDGQMRADSADAGAFAAWRNALVRQVSAHPRFEAMRRRPHGRDALFAPWLDPLTRIGLALESIVAGLRRLGDDVDPFAVAALVEVAHEPPAGRWGRRHVLHPVRVPFGPAGDDPALAVLRDPVELSGDTDCVLATSSTPGVSDVCWRGPVARFVWDLADRTGSRWIVPFGASGRPDDPHFADQLSRWASGGLIPVPADDLTAVPADDRTAVPAEELSGYEEKLAGLGRFRLVPLDPAEHIELVHSWVIEPRAQFWGMTSYSRDGVRAVYEFIGELTTHHAYLMTLDGTPVGIFQTYEPVADPVGECYPVEPGDIGIHLFLAAPGDREIPGFTGALAAALNRHLFSDPTVQRIVVEPDVRNERALRRWRRLGFTFGGQIDLADKRAQLAFLTRDDFESAAATNGR